jgi:hypothetical protein
MIGEAFTTDLPGTPAFAHRVDQLNAIRVDHPEYSWGAKKAGVQF